MGQRQNRKRIRHRPMRSRKASELRPSPIQPPAMQLLSGSQASPPTRSVRWLYPSCQEKSIPEFTGCCSGNEQENAAARERRIFGGESMDSDDAPTDDLRGQMLGVVYGLFGGLDYDEI
ncbi:hypothetical protein LTS10_003380 [Elasticomyces elasticus]|nr:hypothetical protein LTS10_003380 [Elasticomyces elasticus]